MSSMGSTLFWRRLVWRRPFGRQILFGAELFGRSLFTMQELGPFHREILYLSRHIVVIEGGHTQVWDLYPDQRQKIIFNLLLSNI